jgi:hypothetical protein
MIRKRKSINYINNPDLYQAMKAFKTERNQAVADGKQLPQIPNYVGQAIMLIANNLARKGNFGGYSFRDEMISDGIENCIMYLHNFNPDKSKNPFGYISLIISRAYIRRIEKEAKHSYIRHKLLVTKSPFFEAFDLDPSDLEAVSAEMTNDKSSDIINNFETKLANKKEKKRLKDEVEQMDLESSEGCE